MCMITYLPPLVKTPVEGIRNGTIWNDDGHGWAVAADTGLMITGRYMDAEIALQTFTTVREAFPHAPALFHSRWATHGLVNTKNVHPFYVDDKDTVVAHNGILPDAFHPSLKDTRSDTAIMAQEWLGRQTKGQWTRKERRRIGSLIGGSNKLAILSVSAELRKPKGFLVNADRGEWDHGVWYSNSDYLGRPRYSSASVSGGMLWIGDAYKNDGWNVNKERRDSAYHAFSGEGHCPNCGSEDGVDLVANACRDCDWCIDCWEPCSQCACYVPRTATAPAAIVPTAMLALPAPQNGSSSPLDTPEGRALAREGGAS